MLSVGANIDYSLMPISKSSKDTYFNDANFRINQSNMLGGKGSRMFLFGIDLKLTYCL